MLGHLILKIRKQKRISKAFVSRETLINAGHITHIEKSERTPSHKALKEISLALDVPYQQLAYAYDKELPEKENELNIIDHIAYSKIPAISSFDTLIECPSKFGTAAYCLRINDDSMVPKLPLGSYAYIEANAPIISKDIVLIYYENTFYIRQMQIRKEYILLKPFNNNFPEIKLTNKSDFKIIGKILGTNLDY